jgi:cell division septum initiation protein DivIVA
MTLTKANKAVDLEQAPRESGVEGEIREFVRRDAPALRRAPESDSELIAQNINTLVQRVAGTSVQEVDRLIVELQQLRDLLQQEGARVQREITEYAHLSQSAMQSTKIIAESLAQWKGDVVPHGARG